MDKITLTILSFLLVWFLINLACLAINVFLFKKIKSMFNYLAWIYKMLKDKEEIK